MHITYCHSGTKNKSIVATFILIGIKETQKVYSSQTDFFLSLTLQWPKYTYKQVQSRSICRILEDQELPSISFSFSPPSSSPKPSPAFSFLPPLSLVPYALDWMITVDIFFNPRLILAFYKYSQQNCNLLVKASCNFTASNKWEKE